jgi:predicted DNA-binding transcriptional regulator YafY
MNLDDFKRLHELISTYRTGSLEQLAAKFEVGKSTMSEYIRRFKAEYDAPIAYDRDRQCYCYTDYFDLVIEIKVIRDPPEKK